MTPASAASAGAERAASANGSGAEQIWAQCYDGNWNGLIVPEAFAHPAKMARGLIERIFTYLFETGRLRRGSLVIDPFGGIGTTGIIGASRGCRVVCCELEPRFVALAEQNFALHQRTWEAAGDPLPRIVCGDSRNLCSVLGPVLAEAVVSSPPFAKQMNDGGDTPAARGIGRNGREQRPCEARGEHNLTRNYGDSPGQLQQMPPGSVDGVLASPPYAETAVAKNSNGVDLRKQYETYKASGGGMSFDGFEAVQRKHSGEYGSSDGQLAALPAGTVDGVVSSPPYEHDLTPRQSRMEDRSGHETSFASPRYYGETRGQLGAVTGQTFWQASRLIVLQCRLLLKERGVAVFVTKDFIRNKKRVPFSDDWRRLCEACGFRMVEWIKASLVKETVENQLFGGPLTRRKERKSFFRRLAEKKGSPRIDHEDVLVMERL